jgi:hypothetical protein|tara:strand:+ start:14180 stop:14410 length:231 start_codon:yes stop_codon:yes gene_type:complete
MDMSENCTDPVWLKLKSHYSDGYYKIPLVDHLIIKMVDRTMTEREYNMILNDEYPDLIAKTDQEVSHNLEILADID